MKTKKSLEKSLAGCLNQIARYSLALNEEAVHQKAVFTGKRMANMRDLAERILQATHEASAYHNALSEASGKEPNA
jgi:hypothetical protein